ncbi:hypothetical protein BJ508DRAFT_327922 [Ascobolus immersus RN42]|uniref:Uncharacterized protein n=1 Tax=Ascobolus immersus RN42 TaxID=1160509 RepID=A0A3N4I6S9_ASCIM|nr:hypothetical protein BJ508DRAFT_327922 [Ascobolus immersus RN42]
MGLLSCGLFHRKSHKKTRPKDTQSTLASAHDLLFSPMFQRSNPSEKPTPRKSAFEMFPEFIRSQEARHPRSSKNTNSALKSYPEFLRTQKRNQRPRPPKKAPEPTSDSGPVRPPLFMILLTNTFPTQVEFDQAELDFEKYLAEYHPGQARVERGIYYEGLETCYFTIETYDDDVVAAVKELSWVSTYLSRVHILKWLGAR